ncbi:MAG: hypothetical protein PHI34_07680 [Acidobacteriota bacterium]|nr:hypothetical protein [Acidobacteriota bacterium]
MLKEDLVLGREGGEGGGLFAGIQSLGVDDQENVWILDLKDIKVRIFDKTGRTLSEFGKKWAGPNELQRPNRMIVMGDGTAMIMDAVLNKIAFFTRDGRCLKELPTTQLRAFQMIAADRGFLYLGTQEINDTQGILRITRCGQDLKAIHLMTECLVPRTMGAIKLFMSRLLFQATGDGRLIWALSNAYEFTILDAEGRTMRKIIKDYNPRKIDTAEEKRLLEENFKGAPANIKIETSSAYPPLQSFIADEEGRIYARTYEMDGPNRTWVDVFDKDGRYISRVAFPEGERPFLVKNEKLYTILDEDEEGRPLVKRYAMTWK